MKHLLVLVASHFVFSSATRIDLSIKAYSKLSPDCEALLYVYDKEPGDDDLLITKTDLYCGKITKLTFSYFEFTGIDPYIAIYYNVKRKNTTWAIWIVPICDNCIFSKKFDIDLDLDNERYNLREVS